MHPLCKMGSVSPKAPLRGIFHSSLILLAGPVKTQYHFARVVYLSGIRLLLSVTPG